MYGQSRFQNYQEQNLSSDVQSQEIPVAWSDYKNRKTHLAKYVSVGAVPAVLYESLSADAFHRDQSRVSTLKRLRRFLSQTAFLLKGDWEGFSVEARFASSILEKILMRGTAPFPTLEIEREALKICGLHDSEEIEEMDLDHPEVGWKSDMYPDSTAVLESVIDRDNFVLDPSFESRGANRPDTISGHVAKFLNEWVPRELGNSAGQWFIPISWSDLLFCHPLSAPLAIKINGGQHRRVAPGQNESHRFPRIQTIPVSAREIEAGSGPNLNTIRDRLRGLFSEKSFSENIQQVSAFIMSCTTAAKVQFAVAEALWQGRLRPDYCWEIKIKGADSSSVVGVVELLEMLKAIEVIYGIQVSPEHCQIKLDDNSVTDWQKKVSMKSGNSQGRGEVMDCFTVSVEMHRGPYHTIHGNDDADCIIRSAYLPCNLFSKPEPASVDGGHRKFSPSVAQVWEEKSPTHLSLRLFLRHIYRKRDFLEGQGKAILNALKQSDTIVLLPTGGGKSIIYQLAGILMPGVTLVLDPLIALMDDQVDGFRAYGIDRMVAIHSAGHGEQVELASELMKKGQYYFVFVSPERLQIPKFRESIGGLPEDNPINFAVVDEAHCVSEWGHDFRPAYLGLTNSLRRITGTDEEERPPILALTGTASYAVLRDMINDLEVRDIGEDTLIRPESFDRKEIKFRIIKASPVSPSAKADVKLTRELQHTLPTRLGMPSPACYGPNGRKTNSGIIFVPTVNGMAGIDATRELVMGALPGVDVTFYCGKPPKSKHGVGRKKWNEIKRTNARRFKQNEAPLLVSTKAFGMGIDKPNIRFTIHYATPTSLEQYYQEVGRAGRDRKEAYSTLIFSEIDESISDQMLDPALNIEELRRVRKSMDPGHNNYRDDTISNLWFHLQGFQGKEIDLGAVEYLVKSIAGKPAKIPIPIPFSDDKDKLSKEKAIYRLYRLGYIKEYTVKWKSVADTVVPKKKILPEIERFFSADGRIVLYEIHDTGDSIKVKSPYNETFIGMARNARGRWDHEQKMWTFYGASKDRIKQMCAYAYEGKKQYEDSDGIADGKPNATISQTRGEFKVTTNEFNIDHFCKCFREYVRKVAPGRLRVQMQEVARIDTEDPRKFLIGLAEIFINLTYNAIERARRRAIQETILLARQCKADEEIRRRLLDYLQEGRGSERILELCEREKVDLSEWLDLVILEEEVRIESPWEAGELRGRCIRALESYAEHPGALMIRGIAEAMAIDYYWDVAYTSIRQAIMTGTEEYSISAEDFKNVIARLLHMSREAYGDPLVTAVEVDRIEPVLTYTLFHVAEEKDDTYRFTSEVALNEGVRSNNPETMAILNWYRLDQLMKQLESVCSTQNRDFEEIRSRI